MPEPTIADFQEIFDRQLGVLVDKWLPSPDSLSLEEKMVIRNNLVNLCCELYQALRVMLGIHRTLVVGEYFDIAEIIFKAYSQGLSSKEIPHARSQAH